MTALAGLPLRLPKATTAGTDFDTANLRYKCTERYSAAVTDARSVYGTDGSQFSNRLSTNADLTEASLEEMLNQMRDNMKLANYVARPNRIIVSQAQYKDWLRARDREKIKSVWEWLWTRILPA